MRPMSPRTTTISTTMLISIAVPIRNSTNRFASGMPGRKRSTAAQAATGTAIQPISHAAVGQVKQRNQEGRDARFDQDLIRLQLCASDDAGVEASHCRVSHASQNTMMKRNTPQCVR